MGKPAWVLSIMVACLPAIASESLPPVSAVLKAAQEAADSMPDVLAQPIPTDAPETADAVTRRNRDRLVNFLSSNARYENDFDETYALANVMKAPIITDLQFKLLATIFQNAGYDNNFDEDRAFLLILEHPEITEPAAAVLSVLATESCYDNDFDESWAFEVVARNALSVTFEKSSRLIDIFHRARYHNSINDNTLFWQVLTAS